MKNHTLLFNKILFCAFFWLSMLQLNAENLAGVKIFINPGHGGYDSDDRNVVIAPYASGDRNGFWESQSNLDKGLALRTMLQNAGATVQMSRSTNTTADDLPLSQIVAMGNTMQADFFLSIHSNAGNGVASYVLMIHYGSDLNDTQSYPTYNPTNAAQLTLSNKSRDISTEIARNLYANQITSWSSAYQVRGDKTFARTIMGWSDGYGALRGLAVPGVISEGAMHDYIPETYRMMNIDYKWLEAWNFHKSFCNYFNGGQIANGIIAGQVRDSRIKNEASYTKFVGNDQMLPLNGAKLTVVETNETYMVDNFHNGVFVFKNLAPGTYHVKAEKEGYYPKTQEITVAAHAISYFNFALNRVRNTAPQVIGFTPNVSLMDSVEASTSITFSFNWDMDITSTETAFSISPSVAGKFSWEDTNYRMRFTPDKPLDKNTVYTVTLNKTAAHPDNLSMANDFSFQFRTKNRNRLSLIATYPFDAANIVSYSSPAFRLVFDKRLNTANLSTAIKVLDENNVVQAKATRSVQNNTVASPYGSTYFNLASALLPNKEYTLEIDGDVIDEVGMRVVEPIRIRFRTAKADVLTQPVVESFENQVLAFDQIHSVGVSAASCSRSTTKLFGSYSNQLTANFSTSNASVLFSFTNPVNISAGQYVGLHIFGDMSINSLSMVVQDENGIRDVPFCDLKFYGWEFHEVKLPIVGMNKQLLGFRITNTNQIFLSSTVNIMVDNALLYTESATAISSTKALLLSVFPNPFNSQFKLSSTLPIEQYSVYDISGRLIVKVNQGAFQHNISLEDEAKGIYFVRATIQNKVHTIRVVKN